MNTVLTACELCAWACGMEVNLEGGEIEGVSGMNDHPLNEGKLCPKGASVKDYVYSDDRILHPMKKVGASWERIDWEEAINTLTEKLRDTEEECSPKSLATIIGMPILLGGSSTVSLIRRFMDVYGSPNCFSPESMCYRHQIIGQILTTGKFSVADVANAECLIIWGHNPHASKPPLAWEIEKVKERGAQIIVIDPRRTEIASTADLHAQIKPGTDTALALGLMKEIVEGELFDEEFVENRCHGFEELKRHLRKQDLREIENLTRVDRKTIREIARIFAASDGACIAQGVNALDQHAVGVQNARAITMLHALTGNIDSEGGLVRSSRFHPSYLREEDLLEEYPLGIENHPLFYEVWDTHFGEGQGMYLYDALIHGDPYPIKTLIVSGSNPLITWPNSEKLREGIENTDFVAVMDLFMTETAEAADLVLPAASFLEREELCDYYSVIFGIPYVMLRKKVIEPLGESMSDVNFWLKLAKGMGGDFEKYFPWDDSRDVLEYVLEPTDLSADDLMHKFPGGTMFGEVQYGEYRRYGGFKTPSGKVELFSETLEESGYDSLPTQRRPEKTIPPNKSGGYPLVLTTGSRLLPFTHSQMRNIQKLARLYESKNSTDGCFAEIDPETARRYGIEDGERIRVITSTGEMAVEAKVTEGIITGVVNISHGWKDSNVNVLTDNEPADPISGTPNLKAELCKLER